VLGALLHTAERQGQHQEAHEPTRHFLSLPSGAIASGRAHVAAPDGLAPQNPGAWGWREHVAGTGDFTREEWNPKVDVGWIGADSTWSPRPAMLRRKSSPGNRESLGVSPRSTLQRLDEKNLLVSSGKDGWERFSPENARRTPTTSIARRYY
jgi:hypothetical protein